MGRFLAGLFGAMGKQTSQPPASLRVQSSIYGTPIPLLVAGQQRMASNLLWFGNNTSVSSSSSGGTGGKGGDFFGNAGSGSRESFYYASIVFGICEGPVTGILKIWPHSRPKDINQWANSFDTTATDVTATTFIGDYAQMPWGFLETFKSGQFALNYRGIAYAAIQNYPLGPSNQLPNVNWEVRAINSLTDGVNPDGDPSVAFEDWLTNTFWGVGFPTARLGDLTLWQNYCLANGLLVSPAVTAPIQASAFLIDLLTATNSNARWSGGQLTVVPYGDQAVATGDVQQATEAQIIPTGSNATVPVDHAGTFVANVQVINTGTSALFTQVPWGTAPKVNQYSVQNGIYKFNHTQHGLGVTISYTWAASASYVPQNAPLYDLTIDDFLPNRGSIGSGVSSSQSPLIIVRKPRDQMLTSVRVESLDRNFDYNPIVSEVKDEASINLYRRERPGDIKQLHLYCLSSAAQFAATQMLVREQIPRTYQFTVGRQFILVDVLDYLTVSDPAQNVFRQLVQVDEITENDDRSLTMTCVEAPGTAQAPLFGTEAAQGFVQGSDADPGNVNTPIIFEPTAELLGGASQEIWCAVSGASENWGGCYVWVSTDGTNYRQQPGFLAGPARQGVTTAVLPPVTASLVAQTIDDLNTLSVDLTQSHGELASASSAADAQALHTRCYVGGEIIAYQNATLTATNKYDLTYLVRGAYGTEANIVSHPTGTQFARLDAGVYSIPFDNSLIGKTLFIKFQSFNLYHDSPQSLADVSPFQYKVLGTALSSPLPNVTNVASTTVDNRLVMVWDEVASDDFRNGIFYEIRAGSTPEGGVTLGIVAHPPFVFPSGTNTYWIAAWCQPIPALIVRSETWSSIAVSNAQVVTNIIATFDEKALGWPGTFTNGAGIDVSLNAVRTGGTGNILTEAVLATISSGSYVSGTGQVTLTMSTSLGINPGDNVLIFGATGTGANISSLNGVHQADTGTTGTTLKFTIATGLAITTITGGNYTLASVLDSGGEQSGTYTASQVVDVGRVDTCAVYAQTTGTGVPVGQNILAVNDILAMADVLGSASAAFVNVYPEIAFGATNPPTNWQKFAPGKFTGRYFKMRWQLQTFDPNTIAYLLTASFSVDVPDRIDHPLINGSLSASGLAITFTPDGSGTPAAFNGGPDGGTGNPAVIVTWAGSDKATGDFEAVTSLSKTGATVTIKNAAGTAVARSNVSIYVEGW